MNPAAVEVLLRRRTPRLLERLKGMAEEVTHRARSINTPAINWPVILFMAAQTSAGIWWASSVSTRVDFILVTQSQERADSRRELAELKQELLGQIDSVRRSQETDRVYIQDIREKQAGARRSER